MVSSIPSIAIPPIVQTMAQGAKVALPVDSSSLVYSHFEYVSGMPAPEGSQGVSISKLNLLDVLIGQLSQLKKESLSQVPVNPFEGMDSIIENFNNQVRQAKAASEAVPYISSHAAQSGAFAQSGALFSLTI